MFKTIVVLGLFTLLAANGWAQLKEFPKDAQPLTDEALRQTLTGKVFKVMPSDGIGWRLDFKDNGYVYLNTDRGSADTGKWRAQGNQLCVEWRRANSGCSEVRAAERSVYMAWRAEVVELKAE